MSACSGKPIHVTASVSRGTVNTSVPRKRHVLPTTRRVVSSRTSLSLRSEEHTSELQSPCNLVCRLLLEKKKQKKTRASAMLRHPETRPRLFIGLLHTSGHLA